MGKRRTIILLGLLGFGWLWAMAGVMVRPLLADDSPQHTQYLPLLRRTTSKIVIAAAHIDSTISGEADEAILLWNVGEYDQPLAGWQIKVGSRAAQFPPDPGLFLRPGQRLWCAAEATAFARTFGHQPDCEWRTDTDPAIPDLSRSLTLGNPRGVIRLLDQIDRVQDVFVYGDEDQPVGGWEGPAAQAYDRGDLSAVGQVWQRKRDPITNLPLDTDQASDWSGEIADLEWGRNVRYPGWLGWDEMSFARPISVTLSAQITVSVGPEGLYQPVSDALASAQRSINISGFTFEHPELALILVNAIQRGVQVRLLLEGGPAGGISDLQKWCVQQIAEAGGDVRYLAVGEDAPNGARTRYRFLHAKYVLIDGDRALVGTENFSRESMPLPSSDPALPYALGRRGVYLTTDALPIVDGLQQLFDHDWSGQLDVRPYEPGHPTYGPPDDPVDLTSTTVYTSTGSPYATSITGDGEMRLVLQSAPENALRPDAGLIDLFHQAGAGDAIYLMQLYEHKHWGETVSNPIADPNPRLRAVIGAARRGARVRLLLDSYFDDPHTLRNNQVTAEYLHALAAAEGLDIQARVGNPAGRGIHAKVVLVRAGGKRWSAVGSLNGGEVSHKLNREVVLMTDAPEVYLLLWEMFGWDWAAVEE